MCRMIRVPRSLDQCFRPLHHPCQWDPFEDVRVLVLVVAFAWGRHHVANVSRYLDAQPHRPRVNNFFLLERWDPEAALRQKAQAVLRALRPSKGETVSLISDDSKTAKRGKMLEAIATMQDPPTEAYIRGHQDVCAILVDRDQVLPWGSRLSVKNEQCAGVGVPFHKTTALAAQPSRECNAPAGVQVLVLFDADDLCPPVGKACREHRLHVASPLTSHRHLLKPGWQRKAGRYGRHLLRRRRPQTLVITKPHGRARDRFVEAGWLTVGPLGRLHVVFSRKGTAKKLLGLVSDAPALAAAQLIQTDDRRWPIEPWVKDVKPLLGLGQYQHRADRAAVIHRHLVCVASALLTHLRIHQAGAQGHRTRDKAADRSTAAAQDQLRRLLWEDLLTSLKEERHDHPVIEELERLRVA